MKKILQNLKENWITYGFETLVVILGILIAFGLNNWRDHQNERALEKEYLERLRIDFQENRKSINEHKRSEEYHIELAELLIDVVVNREDKYPVEKIAAALEYTAYLPFLVNASKTYSDLIATGNIRLIQNQVLADKISTYYSSFEGVNRTYNEWDQYKIKYRFSANSILGFKDRREVTMKYDREEFPDSLHIEISKTKLLQKIWSDPKLEALIGDVLMTREVQIVYFDFQLNAVEEILRLLEEELDKYE